MKREEIKRKGRIMKGRVATKWKGRKNVTRKEKEMLRK